MQTQAEAGTFEYPGPLWQFSETPVEFYQPPVMLGEHNDYVYRKLLGYSDEEIEALRAAGHITMDYAPNVR
jgi:benzylsuccinate CoA-transferase BbsF subunit